MIKRILKQRWLGLLIACALAFALVGGVGTIAPQAAAAQGDSYWMGSCSNWYGWCVIPVCSNGVNSITGTIELAHYGQTGITRTIYSQYTNNSCVNFEFWLDGSYTVGNFYASGNNPFSTVVIQRWAAGPYT